MKRKINKENKPGMSNRWNMAFMFPADIAKARKKIGLVILPLAPLEWHGPHLAMGCDNLMAHAFARRLAVKFSCPYFPPLLVGTERERTPDVLNSIGFNRNEFIEGMDFPKNSIRSACYREETFAFVVRDSKYLLFSYFPIQNIPDSDNFFSFLVNTSK